MKLLLEDAIEVGNGIWMTHVAPHQLAMLGECKSSRGRRSVLLAASPTFDEGRGLILDTETLSVLNLGTTPSTVVIDTAISAEALERADDGSDNYGPGDREFLSLVKSELADEAQAAAFKLFEQVRAENPGDLKRGNRLNFSNTPDNFWYVIVQPRAQSLSVTVRGEPRRFGISSLELKTDRPGYTRFSVSRLSEVSEAIRLIAQSKRRGGTR